MDCEELRVSAEHGRVLVKELNDKNLLSDKSIRSIADYAKWQALLSNLSVEQKSAAITMAIESAYNLGKTKT